MNKGEKMDLTNLDRKLEYLIHLKKQLEQENRSLKKKLTVVTKERAMLVEKNERARSRIKRALSNLRNDNYEGR